MSAQLVEQYIYLSVYLSISLFIYILYIYIYIYIYIIEIIQNLQIFYLKFHVMNDYFQAILKLLQNSNTLIQVWHIAIATNCHLSFTNYPMGLLYN